MYMYMYLGSGRGNMSGCSVGGKGKYEWLFCWWGGELMRVDLDLG